MKRASSKGGHVQKKRDLYYVVIEWKEEGRRRRKWHGDHTGKGFIRRRDAEALLARLVTQKEEASYRPPDKLTFGQYLDEWLEAIRPPAGRIKESTWATYKLVIGKHVKTALGSIELRHLSPTHLDRFYGELLRHGKGDTGHSGKTVRNIHTIIHKVLKDAVRKGFVFRNVAELADPPKPRQREIVFWTRNEAQEFIRSIEADRLKALWTMALTTGMRRGELLGLRWVDLDLDSGKAMIRQSLVSIGYELRFEEPKSDRSRRTIDLDPSTVAELKAHYRRAVEERLAWGPAWKDTGLVFTKEDGSEIHPHSLSDTFERRVNRAGLRLIPLHSLRHTYATLALDAGMKPWDLSDRLGHFDPAFTLKVYRHAIKETQQEAARTAAAFILGD